MHLPRLPSVPFVRVAPPSFCSHHSTATAQARSLQHTEATRPVPRPPPAHQLEAAAREGGAALPPAVADAKRRVQTRLRRLRDDGGGAERGVHRFGAETWHRRSAEGREAGSLSAPSSSSAKQEPPEGVHDDPGSSSSTVDTTEITLPSTEPALFALLLRLSRQRPPPRPEWLAYFHARSEFSELVSPRTYALLLQHIYDRSSNLRLFNELLDEMQERGMWSVEGWEAAGGLPGAQGEWAARIMLKTALREGDRQKVSEVLLKMRASGWGGVPTVNEPRNLGSVGRGHGDVRWKWKGRGKRRPKEEQAGNGDEVDSKPGWTRPCAPSIARYSPFAIQYSTSTFHELDHLLRRQPPHTPKDPTRLKAEDATALVESFVIEGQAPEAFRITQSWLKAARERLLAPPSPKTSPPLSSILAHRRLATSHDSVFPPHPRPSAPPPRVDLLPTGDDKFARIAYHKTALVLLNILLKSLFSERASPGVVRQFLSDFVERNGLPPLKSTLPSSPSSSFGLAPLTTPLIPGLTTLRTLLSGLESRKGGFQKGTAMLRWFVIRWGLPRVEWELLGVDDDEARETRLQFDDQGLSDGLAPHFLLEGTSALLLLRLAMTDYRRWDSKLPSTSRILFATTIREWWATLEKDDQDAEDVWGTRDAKVVECMAVECGLLDPNLEGRYKLLKPVLETREKERRMQKEKVEEAIKREKERRSRGVGRGEQRVAAWIE